MKDKIIAAGIILGLLGWVANALYESVLVKMNENRASIQALIEIHLKE